MRGNSRGKNKRRLTDSFYGYAKNLEEQRQLKKLEEPMTF
jgi:hypothetical protein